MEEATFQERVKYWYRVWYSDGQMQPIHVKYQLLGQIPFLYTQKYLQWYPFAHVPHSTLHWTCSDPSARSCSAKSTEREIKRCLALRPEMRTGMKTKVVFNTFLWYLSDVWLVYTLSYLIIHNLFGNLVSSKLNVCVVPNVSRWWLRSAMQVSHLEQLFNLTSSPQSGWG